MPAAQELLAHLEGANASASANDAPAVIVLTQQHAVAEERGEGTALTPRAHALTVTVPLATTRRASQRSATSGLWDTSNTCRAPVSVTARRSIAT